MEYLGRLSRPYSKFITVAEYERLTGDSVHSTAAWEQQCRHAFDAANAHRRVGDYLTAAFPTPLRTEAASSRIHLLGRSACVIPLTGENRDALMAYLDGGEGQIQTNRGSLPCSVVQNRLGLRRTLENSLEQHMLFNGF